jgi:hypothetical protein
VFPIYLYPTRRDLFEHDIGPGRDGRRANYTQPFIDAARAAWRLDWLPDGRGDLTATFGPEDLAAYIYALMMAPAYRERYANFLQGDFPRIFIMGLTAARQLTQLGHQLIQLHLLAGEIPQSCRLVGNGDRRIDRVAFVGEETSDDGMGAIAINGTQRFEPVPREVWDFEIGGFQVCDKWLGDRRGRELTFDETVHFARIVGSIGETIRLADELDAVLWANGGFPISAD